MSLKGPSAQGPDERAPTCDEIATAFSVFDKDGSGTLTVDELIGVLTSPATGTPMTEREAKAFIGKFDTDKNGTLDLQEFTDAMCKPRAKPKAVATKPKAAADIEPHMVCEKGGEHVFAFGKCMKVIVTCCHLLRTRDRPQLTTCAAVWTVRPPRGLEQGLTQYCPGQGFTKDGRREEEVRCVSGQHHTGCGPESIMAARETVYTLG